MGSPSINLHDDCAKSIGNDLKPFEALRNSTLTIVGGTGFLGSWVAEAVTYLNDKHSMGCQLKLIGQSIERFQIAKPHLSKRDDVQLMQADARYLTELPRDTKFLIHAAANPDTRFHTSHPIKTLSTLSVGTSSVLSLTEQLPNLKMTAYLSSGLVYGRQPDDLDKISEDFVGAPASNNLKSVYAEGKRYGEILSVAFRNELRVPITILRPFSFIGPYQGLESPWAVTNFISDALQGRPIRVLGDGATVRSYMYGSDAANWILRILVGAGSGSVYNLGSEEDLPLSELANVIGGHFSPQPQIMLSVGNSELYKKSRLVPNTFKARDEFGLNIAFPLKAAVSKTIDWYRSQL